MGDFTSPTPGGGPIGGGLLGAIGGALSSAASTTGILSSIAGAILKVVNYVSAAIVYTQSYANALFGYSFISFGNVFKALGKVLQAIKDSWLGALVSSLWAHVKEIAARLKKLADTINKVIRQIKKIQDDYFNHYIKPLFDFIQRLRRVLLIFRIFHLKFAQRLDNYLAGLEARLAKNFLRVRQDLNRLSDYINLILDPLGLFQTGTYLRSAARSIGELIALIYGKQSGTIDPTTRKADEQTATQYDKKNALETFRLTSATGLQPSDRANVDEIQRIFQDMGYTV